MTAKDIQLMRQEAYDLFAKGKLEQALEILVAVDQANSSDPQCKNDLAVVLFKLGRFAESLKMFRITQALKGEEKNLLVNNLTDALQEACSKIENTQKTNQGRRSLKILMVCEHFLASGGLLRLEHIAEFLQTNGHSAAFLPFAPSITKEFQPSIPAINLDEAAQMHWDAVIIPGAGFSDDVITKLETLRAENFGVRVQLILNDQSKKTAFLNVNQRLKPHLVLFNNLHWPEGSYREFSACQFHHLLGGVDTIRFFPHKRPRKKNNDQFVIGAQAAKNPEIALEALSLLPKNYEMKFFGFDRSGLVGQAAKQSKRVSFSGPLFGAKLTEFYSQIDTMLSLEENAGWANVVAEAMASGVPVITTRAGVEGLVDDGKNALVVNARDSKNVANRISELSGDEQLQSLLGEAARHAILKYDWRGYTQKLIELIVGFDGHEHYTRLPGMGLFGKASLDERLDGLQPLLNKIADCNTSLDLGAAEGVLSAILCNQGIGRADAYELDSGRVRLGARAFGSTPGWSLVEANLARQQDLNRISLSAPMGGYDIVFYLGIHQHLTRELGQRALDTSLSLCNSFFAIRTPKKTFDNQSLQSYIESRGFVLDYSASPTVTGLGGELKVFKRYSQ